MLLPFAVWISLLAPPKPTWPFVSLPRLTRADRLHLSEAAILKMGIDKWADYAYAHRNDTEAWHEPAPALISRDGTVVVYAKCLFDRNRALLAKKSPATRRRLERLRLDVWRCMAPCITLAWYDNGGGTSINHLPHDARMDVEQMTLDLLTGNRREPRVPEAQLRHEARADLISWTRVTQPMHIHYGTLHQIHYCSTYALHAFDEAVALARPLPKWMRESILSTLDEWTVAGLQRRGA